MQVYDGPGFPVVHADFYRLRGDDELAQIGWDEAIDGAVTMVEWPERAASALPADRLEIALHFDPAYGPEFRRADDARVRGARRALAARAGDRAAVARRPAGRKPSASRSHGDASIRAYERLDKARRRQRRS